MSDALQSLVAPRSPGASMAEAWVEELLKQDAEIVAADAQVLCAAAQAPVGSLGTAFGAFIEPL